MDPLFANNCQPADYKLKICGPDGLSMGSPQMFSPEVFASRKWSALALRPGLLLQALVQGSLSVVLFAI
jgi:hypothetical protein